MAAVPSILFRVNPPPAYKHLGKLKRTRNKVSFFSLYLSTLQLFRLALNGNFDFSQERKMVGAVFVSFFTAGTNRIPFGGMLIIQSVFSSPSGYSNSEIMAGRSPLLRKPTQNNSRKQVKLGENRFFFHHRDSGFSFSFPSTSTFTMKPEEESRRFSGWITFFGRSDAAVFSKSL